MSQSLNDWTCATNLHDDPSELLVVTCLRSLLTHCTWPTGINLWWEWQCVVPRLHHERQLVSTMSSLGCLLWRKPADMTRKHSSDPTESGAHGQEPGTMGVTTQSGSSSTSQTFRRLQPQSASWLQSPKTSREAVPRFWPTETTEIIR